MKAENKRRLLEFIKEVELIESYTYFENKENTVVMIINENNEVEFHAPSKEKTVAVLMSIRLFIQKQDNISFYALGKLCDDPDVSDSWKNEYKNIKEELYSRFNREACNSVKGILTHKDVLDMFLYGDIAHKKENSEAYKLYQKWVTKDNYDFMNDTFQTIIIWIVASVHNLSIASKEELQRIA